MRVQVDGAAVAQETWRSYAARVPELSHIIDQRLRALIEKHEASVCLLEGAGSCVELNLADQDLANFALINRYQAPWILVGDIDRGGIYAQVLGVRACLSAEVWSRCTAVVVNRLRGDVSFFRDGQEDIARRIGKPVYVIPHLPEHGLPDEDGFHLSRQPRRGRGPRTACVVHLPHLAMSDDLEPIASDPLWQVDFCATPPAQRPDAVILPGSTDSLADARHLMRTAWPERLRAWAASGVPLVCVCGGYHLLGESIEDPLRVDGAGGQSAGLGLLPVATVMSEQKFVPPVTAQLAGVRVDGYEIHHGRTARHGGVPLLDCDPIRGADQLEPVDFDRGCRVGAIAGCHVHGVFASTALRRRLLGHGASPKDDSDPIDRWAIHLEAHGLDGMKLLGFS
jgi:adenosylcobyric acid synthase